MSGAAIKCTAFGGVPNKPVLPTAPTSLDEYSPGPLRRQTGQPLGREGDDQRKSKTRTTGNEQ